MTKWEGNNMHKMNNLVSNNVSAMALSAIMEMEMRGAMMTGVTSLALLTNRALIFITPRTPLSTRHTYPLNVH
jgi:hypothetical protein